MHYFKSEHGSSLVLEGDPLDHQMDGTPLTETLEASWKPYSSEVHGVKLEGGESFVLKQRYILNRNFKQRSRLSLNR